MSLKLGILISGRGSNMKAIIDLCADTTSPVEISLVLSNKAQAAGLDVAHAAGIPTSVVDHKDYENREQFEQALTRELLSHGVELVCLAGFMRVLTAEFVNAWPDRILNVHPSLLPSFRGLDAQAQALDAGVRLAGCSVHLVTNELDGGPIIAQAAVPVLPDDTEHSLSQRILVQEHNIYPKTIAEIAKGHIILRDGRVIFSAQEFPQEQAISSLP